MSNELTLTRHPDGVEDRVDKFLKQQFRGSKGKIIERVALRQMTAGKGEACVCDWDGDKLEAVDALVEEIAKAAYEDAEHQSGSPRYAVLAYRKDEDRYCGRFVFRVEGGENLMDNVVESETPDGQGIVAQHMKFTDAAIRTALQHSNELIRVQSRMLREVSDQMNRMAAMQFSVLDLQQKMVDRTAERDLAIRKQDQDQKMKGEMLKKLNVLWPIVAKKVFGDKDGKSTAQVLGEEQLRNVLGSLTQEQLMTIATTMDDAQRASFFELYKAYKKLSDNIDGEEPGESK